MNLKYVVFFNLPKHPLVQVQFEITAEGLTNAIEFAEEQKQNVYLVKSIEGKLFVETVWDYVPKVLTISTESL